nr:hypothetical protein [Ruminococcus sp.]
MIWYIIVSIVLVVILVYVVIKKSIDNVKEKKLKEVVAWCVADNPTDFRRYLQLWQYVSNAQTDLNLLREYCISTDKEWSLARDIIKGFKKDIIQKFLSNQLSIPTSKYVIPCETYFMYMLLGYCEKHQCDYKFLGYDMHKKTISYENYGSWGGQLYDATYELTDFAIVLYKLYYITYMHCKNSDQLNTNGEYWTNEHFIEDTIDSKRLSVSRI